MANLPTDNSPAVKSGRGAGLGELQFGLKSLLGATSLLAASFGIVYANVQIVTRCMALVVGGIIGRRLAGRPAGWISGAIYAFFYGYLFRLFAAAVYPTPRLPAGHGDPASRLIAGMFVVGVFVGGVVGGVVARRPPQRKVSSRRSRAASTEKEM